MKKCALYIAPSADKINEMTSSDVKKTSNIANVRIYFEQDIKCMLFETSPFENNARFYTFRY